MRGCQANKHEIKFAVHTNEITIKTRTQSDINTSLHS